MKCGQLIICCNHCSTKNQYYIDTTCIPNSPCVKDLGVLISSDLKWCSHILHVINIASACAYRILQECVDPCESLYHFC